MVIFDIKIFLRLTAMGRGDEYMKNKAERGGAVEVSTCSQRRWLTAQRVRYFLFLYVL